MKRFFQHSSLLSVAIGLLTCVPATAIELSPTEPLSAPSTDSVLPVAEFVEESVEESEESKAAESTAVSTASGSPASEAAPSTSIAPSAARPIIPAPVPAAPLSIASTPATSIAEISSVDDLMRSQTAEPALGQVTSVDQLSDVQPTDWAYQALQSLVERYGCIAGYPDGTFRGQRAATRFELAAALNACLDRISELIASSTADLATQEDLATLRRLQDEFQAELSTLRGRVDTLEARTAELEANQFSTTTKLSGEIVFGLASVLGGDTAEGDRAPRNPTLGSRAQLNFVTSFTGEDLLTTRLQANNIQPLPEVLGTNEGRLEFDGSSDNAFQLALLRYAFPIGDSTTVYIAGTGNGFVDLDASTQLTPYLDGSAVSLFGLRNPIYNYSSGSGLGLRQFFFDDRVELNLGYLTPNSPLAEPGRGLFNGKYGALAQVIVYPTDSITLGFSYINAYNPTDLDFGPATGSNAANDNFGRPVSVNAYGFSGTIDITDWLAIGGWVGYSHHRYIGRGDGEVWNWAASLSFPDLGGNGSVGGILVGQEPRLAYVDASVPGAAADPDTSLHIEAFYRYRLSNNIDITPGVIWITAPDHNADNRDVVIGVVRTRFFF